MGCQETYVRIYITLILVGSVFKSVSGKNTTDDNITEVVSSICDYEGLCSFNELNDETLTRQTISAENIIRQPNNKCCQPCLCTENCVHENCCPGAIRHPTLHATCRSQYDVFNIPRGLRESDTAQIAYSDYFIVDTCPENAPEDLQRPCLEPKSLEDHVFVSSSDNSVIFKNAKCAECNEVYSYHKWKQILYNEDAAYPNFNMRFMSVNNYLVNTHVLSLPLEEDFNVMAAHRCVTKAKRQRVCSAKTIDTDLVDKCVTMEGPLFTTNGLTFPNTFCLACQQLSLVLNYPEKVCRYSEENRFVRGFYPFVVLLNNKDPARETPANGKVACTGGDIQNTITVSSSDINRLDCFSMCTYGRYIQ